MDKNIMKVILVLMMSLLLTNCGSKYYKIEQENQKVLNKVPKWYMSNYSEKKACNTATFGKGKDKMCIFGVGTAVSPDLNLAIEKAMMIAKANLADIVKGEMNKESKQFITELGKSETKTVVSEVESVLVDHAGRLLAYVDVGLFGGGVLSGCGLGATNSLLISAHNHRLFGSD